MPETSHHIVFNASSGTALASGIKAQQLVEWFGALGYPVSIDADDARPFAERMERARRSAAPVLVAAGGDGTVTALAEIAVETGKTLAILPFGTANLLARDLGLPLVADQWLASLAEMAPRKIDVAEVNGRVFLHKVVIGAVPGIAAVREQIRGETALVAKLGFLQHAVRHLSRLRRFAVEITREDGDPQIERVQSIAVANNDYDEGPGKFFSRARLDEGTLSLYLLRQLSVRDALRLGFRMMLGAWKDDDVLEIENVTSLVIRTRRRRVRAMIDGEVEFLDTPLAFRSRPLALTVLAPPVTSAVEVPIAEAV